MSTYNNFTASFPLADFTTENWETFVRDRVNPKQNNFDEAEIVRVWSLVSDLRLNSTLSQS